jgi:hypothetical protein
MTGARYQIAVDGQPLSNRDDKAIAIEAAEYLKYKYPHAEGPLIRRALDRIAAGDRERMAPR